MANLSTPFSFRRMAGFLVLSLGALVTTAAAPEAGRHDIVVEQAKSFLRDGNAQQAYELLVDYETDWSGRDGYDYLLGVAALDSGHAGEAIFSLQRLVSRRPEFAGARLDLARAYFNVGDNELARIEFDRILKEDPPANVKTAVDSYLEAIETRARAYTPSTQWFADFAAGYDSNAPAATDDSQFLTFTLSPNNLEQSSAFGQVTLGGLYSRPVSPESVLLVTGNVMHRSNPSTHFVDPSSATLGAAWGWVRGSHQTNLGIMASQFWLDRDPNKRDYGVTGSYVYSINDRWNFNGFARFGSVRFEPPLEVQDVDQLMFGVGIQQSAKASLLNVSFMGTRDKAQQTGSLFGNDGYGLQVVNTWFAESGRKTFVNLAASTTEYDDPWYGMDREDDLWSLTLGSTWARFPTPDWTLTLQLNYAEKDSSVGLYTYERWEAALFLRKVFN